MPTPCSLIDALHADGPDSALADRMGLYAWLVGRWEMDAVFPQVDEAHRFTRGEVHAGWALGGRAIQDVWIVPPRGTVRENGPWPGDFYGTTLRVYDPGLDAWHIRWIDPVKQAYPRMVGRAVGQDIVQVGEDDSGAPVRWSFTERTPDSFRWRGERSPDGGASWILLADFAVRRVAG